MASYLVDISEEARNELRLLPGHMRQRIFRLLQTLRQNPRPSSSRRLDVTKLDVQLPADASLYRIRVDQWRIVYMIEENDRLVSVFAIRRRPPYQYEDLPALTSRRQ